MGVPAMLMSDLGISSYSVKRHLSLDIDCNSIRSLEHNSVPSMDLQGFQSTEFGTFASDAESISSANECNGNARGIQKMHCADLAVYLSVKAPRTLSLDPTKYCHVTCQVDLEATRRPHHCSGKAQSAPGTGLMPLSPRVSRVGGCGCPV